MLQLLLEQVLKETQDDALLLLKADKTELIDDYNKTEVEALFDDKLYVSDQINANTKTQDDAQLQMKADKIQLIDAYTKIETNYLLYSKANTGDSYTKGDDDALLLLNADKIQLIDVYSKTEVDTLLNEKFDISDQIYAYIKLETDQLVSQIEASDVDFSNNYTRTKTNKLLNEKLGIFDLACYITYDSSLAIMAYMTFNNRCRFISSKDGMLSVTGSSFIKLSADNTVVLLGAGSTKAISEFGGTIDVSNLEKKTEVDIKLMKYVNTGNNQSINGTKSLNANLNDSEFDKKDKDDSSVLLAGGGDAQLSSFGGLELINIAYTNNVVLSIYIVVVKCYGYGQFINFYAQIYIGAGAGTSGASVTVCTLESAEFLKCVVYADDIVFAGSSYVSHIARFRIGTIGIVSIYFYSLSDRAGGLTWNQTAYVNITYPAAN
ncbi:MAG: hypothetical protein EZS28_008777 [Streblomastix strix]|uniref:Uncharacterized protein n=1 Tax=Streblomastix strix TaxID=222440 RepID=A0A5J4WLI8_9EUKA|nr:MAG: hypothetical protein EZS28_008777 [Streblomastix strix]